MKRIFVDNTKLIFSLITNNFSKVCKTAIVLYKILIPVSIIIEILKYFHIVEFIGKILSPIMQFIGLPGEAGIVWATSMLTNLYGGILSYISIFGNNPLSVGQITILTFMMLIAHSFFVEITIAKKSGVKIYQTFLVRFLGAYLAGILLSFLFSKLHFGYKPSKLIWKSSNAGGGDSFVLLNWLIVQLKNYLLIFIVIYILVLIMEFLKKKGILDFLNRNLYVFFKYIGISQRGIPLLITGLIMGISYGGAFIISEVESDTITKEEAFFVIIFLSLCHSLFEDSLLMISLGADFFILLFGRFLYSTLITYIILKISKYYL